MADAEKLAVDTRDLMLQNVEMVREQVRILETQQNELVAIRVELASDRAGPTATLLRLLDWMHKQRQELFEDSKKRLANLEKTLKEMFPNQPTGPGRS